MKRKIFLIILFTISLMLLACGKENADLTVGNKISGFTLTRSGFAESLGGDIYSFYHERSGATLVYIDNGDPEAAFSIYYHTPMVDETDTNHVFEHAIVTGSKKYPSSNIFFDLNSKSYCTYINASTDMMMSGFQAASMSDKQLLNVADVYLSCMVSPDVISNENIFKREAIRYQLYDKNDEIEMLGSVYAEDFSGETLMAWNHTNNIVDTLYPGEYAANSIGRANYEYKRLTYENAMATYERCYHFDNCIIVLYGDIDIRQYLEFFDKEYMSKEKKHNTDLSMYMDKKRQNGFYDKVYESPAYIGDNTTNTSSISYVMDLSDMDWSTILKFSIFCDTQQSPYSTFNQELISRGIYNNAGITVNFFSAKPYINFYLDNADSSQKDEFYNAVKDTIETLRTKGENEELVSSMIETTKLSNLLLRENTDVGVQIAPSLVAWWIHTGETDYYESFERELAEFEYNPNGEIKALAELLSEPYNSAIVTTVPTPGVAERLEQERRDYLSEMKSKMTDEELSKFIEDSYAFDEWNQTIVSNEDFTIEIDELPEIENNNIIQEEEFDGLRVLYLPTELEKVGQYRLFLDTRALNNDDRFYLQLLIDMSGNFDTPEFNARRIATEGSFYLHNCLNSYQYIFDKNGNRYPTYALRWSGFTKDFETSLKLFMDMNLKSDFTDVDLFKYYLGFYKENYNPVKSDPSGLAYQIATIGTKYLNDTNRYELAIADGYYDFLSQLEEKINNNAEYIYEINDKLHETAQKIFVKDKVVLLFSSNEAEKQAIIDTICDVVEEWPNQTVSETTFTLPEYHKLQGVILDTGWSVGYFASDEVENLKGRYAPFIKLLGNQYIIQKVRIENGAYSAGADSLYQCDPAIVLWTYSDPNIDKTYDIFMNSEEYLKNCDVDRSDLEGYILSTYSDLTAPIGILTDKVLTLTRYISGLDINKKTEFINDIKNASIKDKEAAAKEIGLMINNSTGCFVGNEKTIKSSQIKFDNVISYR